MNKISIIQEKNILNENKIDAMVIINDKKFSINIYKPLDNISKEINLYFENYLNLTPSYDNVKIKNAVNEYGENIFNQVFKSNDDLYNLYESICETDEPYQIEIDGFNSIHKIFWESIKDPKDKKLLSLKYPIIRMNKEFPNKDIVIKPSSTINVLIFTSRPKYNDNIKDNMLYSNLFEFDIKDKMIDIDIVQGGTYKYFIELLESKGPNYYHVLIIDLPLELIDYKTLSTSSIYENCVTKRFNRNDIARYDGNRLYFIAEDTTEDNVDILLFEELKEDIVKYLIPIVIIEPVQTNALYNLIAYEFSKDIPAVFFQSFYSIDNTNIIKTLCKELYTSKNLLSAVKTIKNDLSSSTERNDLNEVTFEVILPPAVFYNNIEFELSEMDLNEEIKYMEKIFSTFKKNTLQHGFWGRKSDILKIENKLLKKNILLLEGLNGSGKTELLKQLASFWQKTNFVYEIFYINEKKDFKDFLTKMCNKFFNEYDKALFNTLSEKAQLKMITDKLNQKRNLIIIDNIDFNEDDIKILDFINNLNESHSFVVISIRNNKYLKLENYKDNNYILTGLDKKSSTNHALCILENIDKIEHKNNPNFYKLLSLLDGYPLAIEVMIKNLITYSPEKILDDLIRIDTRNKTEFILSGIKNSLYNLDEFEKLIILTLMPFKNIFINASLYKYIEELKKIDLYNDLSIKKIENLLNKAQTLDLLTSLNNIIYLLPTLYYSINSLYCTDKDLLEKIENTFIHYYYEVIANKIVTSINSEKNNDVIENEYINILHALNLSLASNKKIYSFIIVIKEYFRRKNSYDVIILEEIRSKLMSYKEKTDDYYKDLEVVYYYIGQFNLKNKKYEKAKENLNTSLEISKNHLDEYSQAKIYYQLGRISEEQKSYESALIDYNKAMPIFQKYKDEPSQSKILHQYGIIAMEKKDYEDAKQYYNESLEIKIKYKLVYSQATTHHQLGRLFEEEKDYDNAKENYNKAVAIFQKYNDEFSQIKTYHQLGRVFEQEKSYEEAKKHYFKSLELKNKYNYEYDKSRTYHQLGRVFEQEENYEEAKKYYNKAIEICQKYNDDFSQISTIHQLGRIFEQEKSYNESMDFYKKALSICVKFKNEYLLSVISKSIFRLHENSEGKEILSELERILGLSKVLKLYQGYESSK
jgi:tetratricopeptide (TPR) repeat protein